MATKHIAPIFLGEVRNGSLAIRDRPRLERWIKSLDGKAIQLVVKPMRRTRSLPQNAWYWSGVLGPIADYTGMTPEETHEAMKMMFRKKIITANGRRIETVDSTASMSTGEFSEFIERVRAFAATELSITIPDPNSIET